MDQHRQEAVVGSAADWRALGGRFRDFVNGAESLVAGSNGELALRGALTSAQPFSALTFLMMKPPSYRVAYLPEVLAAIAQGPTQSLLLARDVLRCMPRAALEDRVSDALSTLLQEGDDDIYRRMAEVIIELRLGAALVLLDNAAAGHPEEEIRALHHDLEGVESDAARWGRLVSEWPIRNAD